MSAPEPGGGAPPSSCPGCGRPLGASEPSGESTCPSCGHALGAADPDEEGEEPRSAPRAPWHFKVMVVGTAGYLGWRCYQGIVWLLHHA